MRKIVAVLLLVATGAAYAACPAYAPYRCVQGANGKMICGCGI